MSVMHPTYCRRKSGLIRRVIALISIVLSISALIVATVRADERAPRADAKRNRAELYVLYDSEPKHLWNRLHRALFVREDGHGELVGHDELGPLLWHDTKHLLEGPSHTEANKLLDEFVQEGGYRLIRDPVKRAVLQHDLWFVFDWISRGNTPARRALRRRLATAIRLLALTRAQIDRLPDTHRQAIESEAIPTAFDPENADQHFLPPDLFDDGGPWVCLNRSGPDRLAARFHFRFFPRSVFLIFMRLPGNDRDATVRYLELLNLFKKPVVLVENPIGHRHQGGERIPVRSDVLRVNPELPQFPSGTQVALARLMIVIDDQGQLVPTKIVENIQTRVYLHVNDGIKDTWRDAPMQTFHEIRFKRARLFAGTAGGLAGVSLQEPTYHHFFAHGERVQFKNGPTRLSCIACHRGNGIHSLNTYSFGHGFAESLAPQLSAIDWRAEANSTIRKKQDRYEWGLLRGLWEDQ